jgi:hypothetical protein
MSSLCNPHGAPPHTPAWWCFSHCFSFFNKKKGRENVVSLLPSYQLRKAFFFFFLVHQCSSICKSDLILVGDIDWNGVQVGVSFSFCLGYFS